eukprot:jgi/Chlat1/1402/Chrsp12S01975
MPEASPSQEQEDHKAVEPVHQSRPRAADFFAEPKAATSSGSEEEEKAHRKEKKRKKREKKKQEKELERQKLRRMNFAPSAGAVPGMGERRKTVEWSYAVSDAKQDYFFDTHGDKDNLVFGKLYRLDVAQFQRAVATGHGRGSHANHTKEVDGERAPEKAELRYFSSKHVGRERDRRLKRVHARASAPKRMPGSLGEFVPVVPGLVEERAEEEGESFEDHLLRRTKELNQLTRERPGDVQLWLDFAAFQDELIRLSRRKVALQHLDKKMAIYERALQHHPDSEALILAYLETCSQADEFDVAVKKWERALSRHPSSVKLWFAYIAFRRCQFSKFSVASMRQIHANAAAAFVLERNRLRAGAKQPNRTSFLSSIAEAETALLDVICDSCRFEWQSGHSEVAIARFQALIEYNVFAPQITTAEVNKLKLFQEFWDSEAPRCGDQSAQGWALWLEQQEQQLAHGNQAAELIEEDNGWSGWQEVELVAPAQAVGSDLEADVAADDDDDNDDGDKVEDEEALMERLGMTVGTTDEEIAKMVNVDLDALHALTEESSRSKSQWQPIRGAGEDALERTVLFDDLQDFLFSVETESVRKELLLRFLHFCDAPMQQWFSSNHDYGAAYRNAMDSIGADLTGLLRQCHSDDAGLPALVGSSLWLDQEAGRRQFTHNLALLASKAFPAEGRFSEALLGSTDKGSAAKLAKSRLKQQRHSIELWTLYAGLESAAGSLIAARRVYETALASLPALPKSSADVAPVMVRAFAEMEAGLELPRRQGSALELSNEQRQRALHVLASYGEGIAYKPYDNSFMVPPTRLLKARKGYRNMLQSLRKSAAEHPRLVVDTALCFALLELLTEGMIRVVAAQSVMEEVLAFVLPAKQRMLPEFEELAAYLAGMHVMGIDARTKLLRMKPSSARRVVQQALAVYPQNPVLLLDMIKCEAHAALSNRLRRYFDKLLEKHPSPVTALFAVESEVSRPGTVHRIVTLFERLVEHPSMRCSVVLWRAYIAFLQSLGRNDAARRAFFRAIHICPWSKELWLDGFRRLAGVLSAKELSELMDIMKDKELRLRTDVYEILLEDEAQQI